MRHPVRTMLAALVALTPLIQATHARPALAQRLARPAAASKPVLASLRLTVQPSQINVERDVPLTIRVADTRGRPVAGAQISVTGTNRPAVGNAAHGVLTLTIHATALGNAIVVANRPGFAAAVLKVPIVNGPPATVAAVKAGLSIQPPKAKAVAGRVGINLLEQYHAITGKGQFASLGLRDGTLVDLNSNTDVMIKDPLHATLSSGELFLEVVHGAVSHQVQVGTAVAATKGTRLDVKVDPKTKTASVTVIEGKVQVSNKGSSVLVGAGQQSTIPPNRPPNPPQPVNLGAILAWIQNLPNTNAATVPPVLNLPQPAPAQVPAPPAGRQPTMTASSPVQAVWSGVVSAPSSVDVPAGTTLTIQPGTTVQMGSGAVLTVEGTLLARGTAAAPIVFTSDAATPKPGDWQYIALDGAGASGSALDHVEAFYGSWNGGDDGMLSVTGGAAPTITDSVFAQATSHGLWADDSSHPTVAGCTFAGDADSAVSVSGEGAGLVTGTRLGAGQRGVEIRDTAIAHDITWHQQDAPFILDGGTLNPGATLTVQPGAVIRMANGAAYHAQGTLLARGTAAAPIVFTSDAANPAPGDWQYLALDGVGAGGSALDHVEAFYGSWNGGDDGMLSVTGGAAPTITDSVFAQATSHGLWADDTSRPTVAACAFAGDAGSAISVPADGAALISGTAVGPGQVGIEVRDTAITHSGTWHQQAAPFLLDGGTLNAKTALTIAAGALFQMASGAAFHVEGTLLARGTAAAPIVFTSVSATPKPGDWQYIALDGAGAGGSALDHVEAFYGSWNGGDDGMLSVTGGAAPTITDSVFAQGTGHGLWADDTSRPAVAGCAFAGDAGSAISVPADDAALISGTAVGSGQVGIEVRDTAITHSGTWHQQAAPFLLDGATLNPGVTITIQAGTTVEMASGAAFHVEGTLLARGTAAAPIVFISVSATPKPGDWQYIALDGAGASGSALDHVEAFYGSWNGGDDGMLSVTGGAAPTITDSVFAQATSHGLWADDSSRPTVAACSFAGDAGSAISISRADAARVHGNSFAAGQRGVEVRS